MNKEEFISECKKINIIIDDEIYLKFEKYFNLLVEWNKKFNMTTIIEKKEVFLLHFYDSLCLSKSVNLNNYSSLCDFGTGAGFPGLALAIIFNKLKITLIESNNKKCTFLNEVIKELKLNNVVVINDRMENYSRKNTEKFDLITCRAVTSIPIILELSVNSLKISGLIIPLKSNCDEEINKYSYLEKELNIRLINKIEYKLPINNANRTIPIYKKINKNNIKYPRNYNIILKSYK
ncbi:MAG: 16S rRNA (guanine(527)-N(7))-methyltransferase RsmG [Bacilli bacterium]|nr:16S rRNA (guanine(527)-N(7))-methyltransferase RsmG [Bacilli bacterium]